MKKNLPINNKEYTFDEDTALVSTTDLKGQITFVNDAFVRLSGYTREELMGRAHNMVRHPDVPPAVFADMWQKLKQHKPWIGVVKNRCKDGGFYWVNAYVTPIIEAGSVIGFQSVRTSPTANQKVRAQKLYDRLNKGKRRFSFHDISIAAKVVVAPVVAAAVPVATGWASDWDPMLVTGSGVIVGGLMALLANVSFSPIRYLVRRSKRILDSKVLQELYGNSVSEAGAIYLAALTNAARIRSANVRVSSAALELERQGGDTIDVAHEALKATSQQAEELHRVSDHIEQLSAAADDVASNAEQASAETNYAAENTASSKQVLDTTIRSIEGLADSVEQSVAQIEKLHLATRDISTVTNVIREIAEQTNLLALNAAIEAARAGEQGRGFAVVADEVRALAKRTQESTQEIEAFVQSLEQESDSVADMMRQGQRRAAECVERAAETGGALDMVLNSVNSISDMSSTIAVASAQQSRSAEDLARNVVAIREAAQVAQFAAQQTEVASGKLATTSREIVQSVTV